jgi:UDP-N-acetylmuramoyl-L-alanyl-D-glutamate--2,6-diaminopimelate ligase
MAESLVSLGAVTRVLQAADLVEEVHGRGDVSLSGVSQDSRRVEDGDLFLAWEGERFDAHDFVGDAERAGAVAAVVERLVREATIPQVEVRDGRHAAALAADAVLRSPWASLFTAAVTGTNGKTTTTILARHLLAARGGSAVVGTLGLLGPDGSIRAGTEGLTTPGPVEVTEWLRGLADEGAASVLFEASSHALEQRRLDGIRFDAVAFTSLSQDHLDYHASLAVYREAKTRLATLRKDGGRVVVNLDEPAWNELLGLGSAVLTYGLGADADVRAENVEYEAVSTRFQLVSGTERTEVDLPLLGRFNVENALAAAGIGRIAGLELEEVGARLSGAPQIPGRLQVVSAEPFRVLIDFAHTPDALRRVLETLRPLVDGRLITVFGAGGDRDRSKRPEMGRVVAKGADVALVTSDNPRTEDPERIIDEVVAGMPDSPYRREADRRAAIRMAVEEARSGDLVLLAGKGHESYQVVGTEKLPFDEAAIALECLAERGAVS